MIVDYTGRQFVVTEKYKVLTESALDRIGTLMEKVISAHVVLTADKYRMNAEVTITCRGQSLVAVCEGEDMMTALRDVLSKLEQQVIRSRQRTTTIMRHPRTAGLRTPPETAEPAAFLSQ